MSRDRLVAKLRTNPDFKALTSYLDDLDLAWELVPPSGKAHPAILIEIPGAAEPLRHTIASTPRGRCNVKARLAAMRRALISAGVGI
jgi:hypothetical protein